MGSQRTTEISYRHYNKNKIMNFLRIVIIACSLAVLLGSCDKNCYECDVERQRPIPQDSIDYYHATYMYVRTDSTFNICGYDVDKYNLKTIEFPDGTRQYYSCNKK